MSRLIGRSEDDRRPSGEEFEKGFRRHAAVAGDPDSDRAADEHEQWLRENVPPHHG